MHAHVAIMCYFIAIAANIVILLKHKKTCLSYSNKYIKAYFFHFQVLKNATSLGHIAALFMRNRYCFVLLCRGLLRAARGAMYKVSSQLIFNSWQCLEDIMPVRPWFLGGKR